LLTGLLPDGLRSAILGRPASSGLAEITRPDASTTWKPATSSAGRVGGCWTPCSWWNPVHAAVAIVALVLCASVVVRRVARTNAGAPMATTAITPVAMIVKRVLTDQRCHTFTWSPLVVNYVL